MGIRFPGEWILLQARVSKDLLNGQAGTGVAHISHTWTTLAFESVVL